MKLKKPSQEVDEIIQDFLRESYEETTPTSLVEMGEVTYRATLVRAVHALCRELGVGGYTTERPNYLKRDVKWVYGTDRLLRLVSELYRPVLVPTQETLGLRADSRLCCRARCTQTPSDDLCWGYVRRRKLKLLLSHASE